MSTACWLLRGIRTYSMCEWDTSTKVNAFHRISCQYKELSLKSLDKMTFQGFLTDIPWKCYRLSMDWRQMFHGHPIFCALLCELSWKAKTDYHRIHRTSLST